MQLAHSKVIFNKEGHTYTLDGVSLQGVTGMLSRQLFPDKYEGVSMDVLAKAAERGTRVHETIELVDDLGVVSELPEAQNYARLIKDNGLRHEKTEYLVSDNTHFASCIDKVYRVNEDTFDLADIKTTYKLDEAYIAWQLSIYAYLFELQNPNARVGRLYGIWLRDDKAKLVEVARKPAEEVKKLLQCEIEGKQYTSASTDVMAVPQQFLALQEQLVAFEKQAKAYEAKKKEFLEGMRKVMLEHGIKKYDNDFLTLTIRADSVRETLDTKAVKEQAPEVYRQFVKTTTVRGGIVLKVK